ncbi:hypothetical protein [Dehalobacter sp. TeCB1]|uniref:hypothetical protein n=1 Tax=Dehalobacter sp. TeCB1 TaxID=1843715 RepID=UPI00083A8373|nr:hypothetical protein [Dehalobacter sp. TeCB1]OCZ54318.1 hypothetical protein A7D23_05995 [Dehalobacter sp. TeCB1]
MTGLIEGRIVHYVRNNDHVPAIVVKVENKEEGVVNLQLFEDYNGISYVLSAGYSEEPTEETWHWIEQEETAEVSQDPPTT